METTPSEDKSLATAIWSLVLWLGLFLVIQVFAIGLSGEFLKTILGLDAVAAGNIAILCGATASYALLFVVARRDARLFPAAKKDDGLGIATQASLIFIAVLLPFGVLGLQKLLFGIDPQLGPSPIAMAQQFQGYNLVVFWVSFLLSFLLALIVPVIIAPIVEESFFRQWLWRRLETHGQWLTLNVTAATFLLIHFRGPLGMLSLVPLTLLVSFARAKTGSPRFGMWLHGINNFIAVAGAEMILRLLQ